MYTFEYESIPYMLIRGIIEYECQNYINQWFLVYYISIIYMVYVYIYIHLVVHLAIPNS